MPWHLVHFANLKSQEPFWELSKEGPVGGQEGRRRVWASPLSLALTTPCLPFHRWRFPPLLQRPGWGFLCLRGHHTCYQGALESTSGLPPGPSLEFPCHSLLHLTLHYREGN